MTADQPADPGDRRRLAVKHLANMRRGLEHLDAGASGLTGLDATAAAGDTEPGDEPAGVDLPAPPDDTAPADADADLSAPPEDTAPGFPADEAQASDGSAAPSPPSEGGPAAPDESVTAAGTADPASLEALALERDALLTDVQRISAEFANYRRQVDRRVDDTVERRLIGVIEKLLPALDAFDSAVEQGALDVEPVRGLLLQILEKEGLERLLPLGEEFDPTRHEAVLREDAGDHDNNDVLEVVEVLRAGYVWRGQVVRPAMVKVRG